MAHTKVEFEQKLRKEGKQPNVESMPPIPVGESPLVHYNAVTVLSDRFSVAFNSFEEDCLIVIDKTTGTMTKLDYTAVVKPAK